MVNKGKLPSIQNRPLEAMENNNELQSIRNLPFEIVRIRKRIQKTRAVFLGTTLVLDY